MEIGKVVGGVFIAVTTIWKVVPKIWTRVCRWMMEALQVQITKMSNDISFIVSELKTNGGASLRDAVVQNSEALKRIENMSFNNIEVQRARMDNEPQMIFITDAAGNCEWTNRSYTRHTGRSLEELKGTGWVNALHPDNRESIQTEWYQATKENREFEWRVKFKDTADRVFESDFRSYKMSGPDGLTAGYLGVGEILEGVGETVDGK